MLNFAQMVLSVAEKYSKEKSAPTSFFSVISFSTTPHTYLRTLNRGKYVPFLVQRVGPEGLCSLQ